MPKKQTSSKRRNKLLTPKRLIIGGLAAIVIVGTVAALAPAIQSNLSDVAAGTCRYPGAAPVKPTKPSAPKLRTTPAPKAPTDINGKAIKEPLYYGITSPPALYKGKRMTTKEAWSAYHRDQESFESTRLSNAKYNNVLTANYNKAKAAYNKNLATWKTRNAAYQPKINAYNACSAKLRSALNKAQAAVNSAKKPLDAAEDKVANLRNTTQNKRDAYESLVVSVVQQEQVAAQKAYNDIAAKREAAKNAVATVEGRIATKQQTVQSARAAYNAAKKPAPVKKKALDDAVADLQAAKNNLENKQAALRATLKPFQDAQAVLTAKNNRLAYVKTPAAAVKRDAAKSALDKAVAARDAAIKNKDAKKRVYDKAVAARNTAQTAYNNR